MQWSRDATHCQMGSIIWDFLVEPQTVFWGSAGIGNLPGGHRMFGFISGCVTFSALIPSTPSHCSWNMYKTSLKWPWDSADASLCPPSHLNSFLTLRVPGTGNISPPPPRYFTASFLLILCRALLNSHPPQFSPSSISGSFFLTNFHSSFRISLSISFSENLPRASKTKELSLEAFIAPWHSSSEHLPVEQLPDSCPSPCP